MKIPYELMYELENIHFKYERLEALISLLQTVIAEEAEVRGLPTKSLEYSFYEIDLNLMDNNKKLEELMLKLSGKADQKKVG